MTLIDKIKSLTWWNEISKLKDILFDLEKNGGSGSGGGSFDTISGSPLDNEALAAELNLKEVSSNKQNNLTSDGTGTKYTTVDAVIAGLASKLSTGGYTGTAKDLETLIVSAVTGVTGVAIVPTSVPTGTGVSSWIALQPGTYTNFGFSLSDTVSPKKQLVILNGDVTIPSSKSYYKDSLISTSIIGTTPLATMSDVSVIIGSENPVDQSTSCFMTFGDYMTDSELLEYGNLINELMDNLIV